MALVPIKKFCETRGLHSNSLYVSVNFYKKRNNGRAPKWFIKTHKGKDSVFVDTDIFFKRSNLELEAWKICTNELYWLFTYYLKIKDIDLGRLLNKKGIKRAWGQFFSQDLWAVPPEYTADTRISMRFEFLTRGTKLAYLLKKFGYYEIIDGEPKATQKLKDYLPTLKNESVDNFEPTSKGEHLKDFDSVSDYFGYYEALKIKKEVL